MKKLFKVTAVICFTVLCFASAKAQSSNSLEGRARGAAHDCLEAYHGGLYEITTETTTLGICFVEGFISRVSIYAGPKCNGPGPCPAFPTVLVATVDFGCEGEIMAVTCY